MYKMMSKLGVIYVYWGDSIKKELNRSIESLKKHHPELPYECIELPNSSGLIDKAKMLEWSPFETTLFLDTDTVVLDRLDFAFQKAEQYGLACCINECPWARRYCDIAGDQIEYNTGVLFFTKEAKPVFEKWSEFAQSMDSSIVFRRKSRTHTMPSNDQAGFSEAMEETGFNPFVLPMNWNLRPLWQKSFFGPVKIWHDRSDVPLSLKFWNEDQQRQESIIKYSGDPQ